MTAANHACSQKIVRRSTKQFCRIYRSRKNAYFPQKQKGFFSVLSHLTKEECLVSLSPMIGGKARFSLKMKSGRLISQKKVRQKSYCKEAVSTSSAQFSLRTKTISFS